MSVYKAAEYLQEALDLLSDLEKRRATILGRLADTGKIVSLAPKQVETLVDATYEAATGHLLSSMMGFRKAYEDQYATKPEGS